MALLCLGAAQISGSVPVSQGELCTVRQRRVKPAVPRTALGSVYLTALADLLTPTSHLNFMVSRYQVEVELFLSPSLFWLTFKISSSSLSKKIYCLKIQMVRIELFIEIGVHVG